jgi:phosphoribosylformylglycinamidine (FGAM) synthase-like amidotransferase family enzyme
MKLFKYLVVVIGLSLFSFLSNPAMALTSSYDKDSQILVIDGVNLDQDFTLTESDLSELLTDRKNTISDLGSSFKIRFFFSPSVEAQIIKQIESNQNNDGVSPSLEILKNNDLRTTRTRVKVARVEKNKKSFGFLNFINPDTVVKLVISTEYTFDLHDFSNVDEKETVGFEFEISSAKTFSGNIDFKVSLNSIETGSDTGGSSVDNGSGSDGGSTGGGTTGGGSTGGGGVANNAINADLDAAVESITTKLGDVYDVVNKTVVCGNAGSDEVDVCDPDSLNDFSDSLLDAKNDLKQLETENVELKQIINTARKDGLLTKKEANKIKDTLDANDKKINAAKKEVNDIIKKIDKNNGKGFNSVKAQNNLQTQLDKAKNKIVQAHSDLKSGVLRPLLDKSIISDEVYDKYNVDIEEIGDNASGGSSTDAGTTVTTVSTTNPDGSVVVANADGSTTTLPDGTVIESVTNADGSVSKTTTNPDGSVTTSRVVTNEDGSVTETITNSDGTISIARSVTNEDGSVTTTTTNPDGTTSTKTVVREANGTITTFFDDGSVEVKKPDGSVSTSVENADGSITTTIKNADGTTTIERATQNEDGSISTTVTNPDGSTIIKRVVSNEDGSVTTTITNPDGSITTETAVLNDDGSITTTITNPDGTTITKTEVANTDGSITTTTVNSDGTTDVVTRNPNGSTTVTNADGSITTTKLDGTEITKTQNADGTFTVFTKNPDGTTTTGTEVINSDGSVTTTTINPDGSTTVSTAITNSDGSVTTTTTVTTPNTDDNGDGESVDVTVAAALTEAIEEYSFKVAESFQSIDRNYVCGSSSTENSVDICDIEGIIAFQTNIIESNSKLRNIIVDDSRTLLRSVNDARRARLISKKRAKRLRFRIKRNNVRIIRARRTLVSLDDRIKARVSRGRPFDSAKANKFFLDTISKAQFRINRSYVKLQETVVRPLFNQRLISEETKSRFDVSISELN